MKRGILRSSQSCEAIGIRGGCDNPAMTARDDTCSHHDNIFLVPASCQATKEERATSTVLPSIQQVATSTSDLNVTVCPEHKGGACPIVIWQCCAVALAASATPVPAIASLPGHVTAAEQPPPAQPQPASSAEAPNGAAPSPPSAAPATADEEEAAASGADICRICHCTEADPLPGGCDGGDNPLISPCLCSGSLKYVHRDCLQYWVKSQDIQVCELCRFGFLMSVTTKPINEWKKLDMSAMERRKIICSVSFHVIALTCVIWSLYVLIEKTTIEIYSGKLEWQFWTKLVVVAIGFTGGIVFMYVQCRTYVGLCRRWRSFNRTFLIQSASEEELSAARIRAKASTSPPALSHEIV